MTLQKEEVGGLKIDKESPLPIYYQLKEFLKESIEKGEWLPGQLIPSERELSERFGISRMTVRQAVTDLVRDGYLKRQRGKGTFVAEKKIERSLGLVTGFTEEMLLRGHVPGTEVKGFAVLPADPEMAQLLQIEEGASIYEIKRLRLADGIPMAFETNYIPVERLPGLTKEKMERSLFEYVENELSLTISHGRRNIEASIARKGESHILGIPEGSPVLLIRGITYFSDGKPMEIVKSIYRGDRYTFTVDLRRGST